MRVLRKAERTTQFRREVTDQSDSAISTGSWARPRQGAEMPPPSRYTPERERRSHRRRHEREQRRSSRDALRGGAKRKAEEEPIADEYSVFPATETIAGTSKATRDRKYKLRVHAGSDLTEAINQVREQLRHRGINPDSAEIQEVRREWDHVERVASGLSPPAATAGLGFQRDSGDTRLRQGSHVDVADPARFILLNRDLHTIPETPQRGRLDQVNLGKPQKSRSPPSTSNRAADTFGSVGPPPEPDVFDVEWLRARNKATQPPTCRTEHRGDGDQRPPSGTSAAPGQHNPDMHVGEMLDHFNRSLHALDKRLDSLEEQASPNRQFRAERANSRASVRSACRTQNYLKRFVRSSVADGDGNLGGGRDDRDSRRESKRRSLERGRRPHQG